MHIGIIGAGAVAAHHARAAQSLGITLAAVCDLQPDVAQVVAQPYGAQVFTDYRDVLTVPSLDAVIVNTPHALHHQMVLDAAAAGLHILVEKPMATTVSDCHDMEYACRAAHVHLEVGLIQHYLPEKVAIAHAIASGRLGRVLSIHDQRGTDYRPGSRSPWFFDPAMSGGGALMNIGAHCIDRSLWFGGAPAASLTAHTRDRFRVGVETDGEIHLTLHNGVEAHINVVTDCPQPMDQVLIVCEKGTLLTDPRRGAFARMDGETSVLHTSTPADIQRGFTAQLANFASTLAGNASALAPDHAVHVLEVVLAAYDSSRSQTPIIMRAHETC